MATLANGIVGHDVCLAPDRRRDVSGRRHDYDGVKSPMLAALGAYLPFETTLAHFRRRCHSRDRGLVPQASRPQCRTKCSRGKNAGILIASGPDCRRGADGLALGGTARVAVGAS